MLPAALMLGAATAGLGGALRRPAGDAERDPDPAPRPRDAARVPNAMTCADVRWGDSPRLPWRDSSQDAVWASGMPAQKSHGDS